MLLPLAKAGVSIVGIDRSEPMLAHARMRLRRLRTPVSASIVRGDIRQLPFAPPSGGRSRGNDADRVARAPQDVTPSGHAVADSIW